MFRIRHIFSTIMSNTTNSSRLLLALGLVGAAAAGCSGSQMANQAPLSKAATGGAQLLTSGTRDALPTISKIVVTHKGHAREISVVLKRTTDPSRKRADDDEVNFGSAVYPGDLVDVYWNLSTAQCTQIQYQPYDTTFDSSLDPPTNNETYIWAESTSVQHILVPLDFPPGGSATFGVTISYGGQALPTPAPTNTPGKCYAASTDNGNWNLGISATSSPSPVPTASGSKPTSSPSASPCYYIPNFGAYNSLIDKNAAVKKLAQDLANLGKLPTNARFGPLDPNNGINSFADISGSAIDWDTVKEPATASDATQAIYHELLHVYIEYLTTPGMNGVPSTVTATVYGESGNQDVSLPMTLGPGTIYQQIAYEHFVIHNLILSAFGSDPYAAGEAFYDLKAGLALPPMSGDPAILASQNVSHPTILTYSPKPVPSPSGACK